MDENMKEGDLQSVWENIIEQDTRTDVPPADVNEDSEERESDILPNKGKSKDMQNTENIVNKVTKDVQKGKEAENKENKGKKTSTPKASVPNSKKIDNKKKGSSKTPGLLNENKKSVDENDVRSTARNIDKGRIDFYVSPASKIRGESRVSKRGSTSPLRGGVRNKLKK